MPSAVLFLLRMPDNKFFEKPIHARTACKPETFSHHHLRCAIRRRQAYSRKAGRSMEFYPQFRFRGDPQDIQHTAAEKSTGAADRENSHFANRKPGLAQCRRRKRPVQDLCARSSQSRAAIPLDLSGPSRQRPVQAALAQSAASPTGIWETLGGAGKDLIRLAEGDQQNSSCPDSVYRFPLLRSIDLQRLQDTDKLLSGADPGDQVEDS